MLDVHGTMQRTCSEGGSRYCCQRRRGALQCMSRMGMLAHAVGTSKQRYRFHTGAAKSSVQTVLQHTATRVHCASLKASSTDLHAHRHASSRVVEKTVATIAAATTTELLHLSTTKVHIASGEVSPLGLQAYPHASSILTAAVAVPAAETPTAGATAATAATAAATAGTTELAIGAEAAAVAALAGTTGAAASTAVTRRSCLLASTLLASSAFGGLPLLCNAPSAHATTSSAAAAAAPTAAPGGIGLMGPPPSAAEIYANYPYRSPADILAYVRDRAPAGDAQAVLDAIDEFSAAYPMYKIGPEKGVILDSLVSLVAPMLVVELGSFVGYSAVRIARLLPPGGVLVCVEANPECVAALEGVVLHAGLRNRVVVEQGLSGEVLPGLASKYGQAQLLFEDHCKPCYLPDLVLAETTGLMGPGSWTIADNVIYPGTPDLLQHLASTTQYTGIVVPARYEYEQAWNPQWEAKQDGMSVAVRLEGLVPEQQGTAAREQLEQLCRSLEASSGKVCMPLLDATAALQLQ